MGHVIDTDVIVNAERRRVGLSGVLGEIIDSDCFLSVITVSELLHGLERASRSEHRLHRKNFLDHIFSRFVVIPIDVETARIHARIWADLTVSQQTIGSHDMWIAATCLRHGHELITQNVKDFSRVRGLLLHTA